MKFNRFLFILLAAGQALAEPATLTGKTSGGDPCHLIIESWNMVPENEPAWFNIHAEVRSPWQKESHPALSISQSPTRFHLYGRSSQNYDVIAVRLRANELEPTGIVSYNFQTWDEERGKVQKYCRF